MICFFFVRNSSSVRAPASHSSFSFCIASICSSKERGLSENRLFASSFVTTSGRAEVGTPSILLIAAPATAPSIPVAPVATFAFEPRTAPAIGASGFAACAKSEMTGAAVPIAPRRVFEMLFPPTSSTDQQSHTPVTTLLASLAKSSIFFLCFWRNSNSYSLLLRYATRETYPTFSLRTVGLS